MADSIDRAGLHPAHDLELIARAASGELAPGETQAARDLLDSCPACAALAGDLRAIAAATRELRNVAGGVTAAPAPRDFRLTESDAARLRRRRWFGLGGPSAAGRARGLGAALATMGLVGLLVSTVSPAMFGAAGSPDTVLEMVGDAAGASDSAATLGPLEAPPAAQPVADGSTTKSTAEPLRSESDRVDAGAPPDDRIVLGGGSALMLISGVVLLLWARRRRTSGP